MTIALGTDIGTSGLDTLVPWRMNSHELAHLVAAGLTPLEAIEAATATGPLTLGPQAPRSGLLAEGYDADVLAISANPLDDINVLTDPANISHLGSRCRREGGHAGLIPSVVSIRAQAVAYLCRIVLREEDEPVQRRRRPDRYRCHDG